MIYLSKFKERKHIMNKKSFFKGIIMGIALVILVFVLFLLITAWI